MFGVAVTVDTDVVVAVVVSVTVVVGPVTVIAGSVTVVVVV